MGRARRGTKISHTSRDHGTKTQVSKHSTQCVKYPFTPLSSLLSQPQSAGQPRDTSPSRTVNDPVPSTRRLLPPSPTPCRNYTTTKCRPCIEWLVVWTKEKWQRDAAVRGCM